MTQFHVNVIISSSEPTDAGLTNLWILPADPTTTQGTFFRRVDKQTSPPTSPAVGDGWIDDNSTFFLYNDGGTIRYRGNNEWAEIVGGTVGWQPVSGGGVV